MHKPLFLLLALTLISCGKEKSQSVEPVRQEDQRTELFANPADGFYNNENEAPHFELVRQARRTVDIEVYQMFDSDFFAELHAALDRGVRVRLVLDLESSSSSCKLFDPKAPTDKADCLAYKDLIAKIRAKGGAFVRFNKEAYCPIQAGKYCYEHGKMILVDERVALLSTGNFNPTNLCNKRLNPSRCNRDYSVITRDVKVLSALNAVFANDLKGEPYDLEAILTAEVREKLTVSPLSLKPLQEFIDSAKHSVYVQNQYLSQRDLNATLMAAAKRGIDVQLMTASECSFGPPDEAEKKRITEIYSAFDASGAKSRMFTRSIPIGGKQGYMHAKAIVVDAERAWVGSVNGSETALNINREFGLFFQEPQEVVELTKIMLSDFNHRGAETWEESLRCAKDFPARSLDLALWFQRGI
jgi:phosphatidylserine/phosphatidylglycerophosphate/cardiolipin synthase-like enzyme